MKFSLAFLLYHAYVIPVTMARCTSLWEANVIPVTGTSENVRSHQTNRDRKYSDCHHNRRVLEKEWHELGNGMGYDGAGGGKKSLTGYAVASSESGNMVAVSSPRETVFQTIDDGVTMTIRNAPRVQVFQLNTITDKWEQPSPDIEWDQPLDEFGVSLAIDAEGKSLVVGTLSDNGANGELEDAGTVTVYEYFRRVGENVWKPKGKNFRFEGSEAFGQFGASVDISEDGNVIAIGSPTKDIIVDGSKMQKAGEVTVYKFDPVEEMWSMLGAPMTGEKFDRFGSAVSLASEGLTSSSHALAVGAPTAGLYEIGYVQIFRFNEEDGNINKSWETEYYDKIEGSSDGDHFGSSVALSVNGTTFAAGAPNHRGYDLKPKSGHVKVYERQINGHWKQRFESIVGFNAGDESGSSVAISPDGTKVAIGSPRSSNDEKKNSGHVSVYSWTEERKEWDQMNLDIDGKNPNDLAGSAVAMAQNGARVIIGSPGGGYARVYELAHTSPPTMSPTSSQEEEEPSNNNSGENREEHGVGPPIEILLLVFFLVIPLLCLITCGMLFGCRYIVRQRRRRNMVPPEHTRVNTDDESGQVI